MTDRDKMVIDFLKKCPCSSLTIKKIFFPSVRVANRRLYYLYEHGHLKRFRETNWDNYYYYIDKKPAHYEHYDFIARTYLWIIQNKYKIHNFEVQKQYNNIIPDMVAYIERNNKKGILPVEIERSHNDTNKKIKQYEEQNFFQSILLVSSKEMISNIIKITNVNIKELP